MLFSTVCREIDITLVPVKAKRRGAKPENLAPAVVKITGGDEFIDARLCSPRQVVAA
ncbi:hypothetical protein H4P12_16515 [Paracoccus sp. 11-3]|uniref:Uncharacterized protein n=1 Tax=Paracoccus amoyensis TaxID=2760093 RepID=A0A926JCK2_9RHOB|nr:hypothetical protein [Paracoccus amoyensis]MBC9248276.1 hypothetical protein [Paracoccus amoyensis]